VHIVVLACALSRFRIALRFSGCQQSLRPDARMPIEGISGIGCNLLYSLCIDETSNDILRITIAMRTWYA